MNVTACVKSEWRPPCSMAEMESSGDFATLRTSTGWKIHEDSAGTVARSVSNCRRTEE